jgi:hypothetical protein
LQPRLLNRGDVNKNVLAAIFVLDESIALSVLNQLNRAFSHVGKPFIHSSQPVRDMMP